MNKDAFAEIAFLLLLASLVGGWCLVQVSGFRAQEEAAGNRQILGVALDTYQEGNSGRDIYRVMINTDCRVDYKITKPTAGNLILVEMPDVRIAPDIRTEPLSNDLIEDVWMRAKPPGRVTIGVELVSAQVRVSDRAMDGPASGVMIDLEPRGDARLALVLPGASEGVEEGMSRPVANRFAPRSEWIMISASDHIPFRTAPSALQPSHVKEFGTALAPAL